MNYEQLLLAIIVLGGGSVMTYIACMLRSLSRSVQDVRVCIAAIRGRFETVERHNRDIAEIFKRIRELEMQGRQHND